MSFDEMEKYFRKEQSSNRVEDKVHTVLYYVRTLGPEKLKRNRRMHRIKSSRRREQPGSLARTAGRVPGCFSKHVRRYRMEPQQSVDHQNETQSESPSKPFTVETDASDFALGYSLLQKGDDGIIHPVAFEGRKLKPAEKRYPTHEKELLAITTVLTDHESLRYMNTVSKLSNRLICWIDEFQGFDLDIRYRRGREAIVPDAFDAIVPDAFDVHIIDENINRIST
jgi:hypothetical protein